MYYLFIYLSIHLSLFNSFLVHPLSTLYLFSLSLYSCIHPLALSFLSFSHSLSLAPCNSFSICHFVPRTLLHYLPFPHLSFSRFLSHSISHSLFSLSLSHPLSLVIFLLLSLFLSSSLILYPSLSNSLYLARSHSLCPSFSLSLFLPMPPPHPFLSLSSAALPLFCFIL